MSVTNRDGGGLDQVRSGSHVNYVSHYSIHSSPIWLEGDTLDLQDNVFTVPEQPDEVTYVTTINPFPFHDPSYGAYSAHDAQFTFERAGNIAEYHDGGKATDHPGGWTQYGAQNWAGNEVLDDSTWRVVLNDVDAAFFVVNFSGDVQLVSKQYTETIGDAQMDQAPMGTGPYRFVSHTDDTDFIFTRFEGHYFPMEQFGSNRPHVPVNKDLEILIRPEVLSQIAGVEAGEIDVAPGLGFNDVKPFLDDSDYSVLFQAAGAAAVHNLYFNTHVTELEDGTPNPFHDIRVRQAANHAVDRAAIATGLLSGTEEQPLFHFSGSNGYPTPEQKKEVLFDYDPERSRALLAEAGFPDGFETTLHIPAGFGQNVDELSLIVQQELAGIGIRLAIREVPAGEYFTDRRGPGAPRQARHLVVLRQYPRGCRVDDQLLRQALGTVRGRPGQPEDLGHGGRAGSRTGPRDPQGAHHRALPGARPRSDVHLRDRAEGRRGPPAATSTGPRARCSAALRG